MRPAARRNALLAVAVAVAVALVVVARGPLLAPDAPGSEARDFVSDKYPKLVVEVDWMVDGGTSYKPSQAVLSFLDQRLAERLSKPGGITVEFGNAITASKSAYTTEDLRALESANRATHTGGDTASIWIVFATHYAESGGAGSAVIGVAYEGSACAVFAASIAAAADPPFVTADTIEEVTVVHEVGHLLGLVNGGTPMVTPHEDAAHPRHSSNPQSVMYWQVEGTDVVSLLRGGGPPNNFDADDIADLRAIGGK